MKRFFMLAVAVCAAVFMGGSKDDEGATGFWVGMWAVTFESDGEDYAVDIYEIKANKVIYRHCTNLWEVQEPVYKNGTLSCNEEAIFEIYMIQDVPTSDLSIVWGLNDSNYKKISEDKIQLWVEEVPEEVETWQRIRNTENIVFK